MKTVKPRFRPERRSGNTTYGEAYEAKCPHCGHKNLAWTSELTKPDKIERVNKCVHFDGFTKAGAFRFLKGLPITEANKDTPRWYRCTNLSATGDYRFGAHWAVEDYWQEEARERYEGNPDLSNHILAVKAPPAEWLDKARQAALAESEGALRRADWLRTELARHYPTL